MSALPNQVNYSEPLLIPMILHSFKDPNTFLKECQALYFRISSVN